MATTRNSVLYASRDVSHYLQDRRDIGGPLVAIKFACTIISATTGDIYNMFTMPANASMIFLGGSTSGIGLSAAGGRTFIMGDSGDTDRLVASTDVDVVNAQLQLAYAGVGWRPTSDTVVYGTMGGTVTVGGVVIGHVAVVLGQ